MVGVHDLLPHEIWTEILSRFPLKAILRFRSVCKSWCSLVSSRDFNSHYSAKNLNKNGNRVLLHLYDHRSNVRSFSFSSHDKSFMESCEHDDVPELFLHSFARIVGSCNGLICLSNSCYDSESVSFMIWNPTIRKIVELPSRSFGSRTQRLSCLGFGFDSNANDYKVLCIVTDKSAGDLCVANIYDLRNGVWRVISPQMGSWDLRLTINRIGCMIPECYLDGAVHWIVYGRGNKSSSQILLSFDMSDECFREIGMPDHLKSNTDNCVMKTMTFGGLIYLIVWKTKPTYFDGSWTCWVMKQYGVVESWTKVLDIDLRRAPALQNTILRPGRFSLWDKDEVVMVHDIQADENMESKQDLVLCSAERIKCDHLPLFTKCISNLCLYEESLSLV